MNHERKQQTYPRLLLAVIICLFSFTSLFAQQYCEIGGVVLEPHDCDLNTNTFLLDLHFDYAETSDSFNISGNGNNYGNFAYTDLPVTLGPFDAINDSYEFVITDLNYPDCTAFAILAPVDCNPMDCSISNLSVLALECNDDGTYSVYINFDHENSPNQYFDVIDANGNYIGFYLLADLPVILPSFNPINGGPYEFLQVCINDTPDCCAEAEFNSLDCPGACGITNITYEVSACNDQDQFFITINFNFEFTGDAFTIMGNGQNYGTFEYSQVPITLGPFEGGTGLSWEFGIFDTEYPNCGGWIEPGIINCSDCEINEVVVEAYDCDPNGLFMVDLDFNYQGTSNTFTVFGNGMNYGNFSYTDLPITLGPFEGNGSVYEFIVQDLEFSDCGAEGILQSENCIGGDCDIFDLVVEVGDCNPNGVYSLWINFEYQNPGNDYFDVIDANGNNVGYFLLSDLPIEIDYGPSNTVYEYVQVCINDNPNCCEGFEFEAPDCNTNCGIGEATFEYGMCDGDFYEIGIDFDYQNTSDSFNLIANGVNLGNYAYIDLPISFGPTNAETVVFVVTDVDQPDCGAESWSIHNCNGTDCQIFEIVVEVGDCNPNGVYPIWINFEYENPGNDYFDVFDGNGNIVGTYLLSDLPVQISYGPSNTNFEYLSVCINDNPDCCQEIEFETPNCNGSGCEIWDLIVESYDCDPNGLFMVDLDFNYQNTSDSFTVFGNGMNYGNFAYSDLYITLGPFLGDGSVYEFIIQDLEQPDCGAVGVLQSENCNGGDCNIFDLEVEVGDCDPNGIYPIWINFEYENPGNDFFDVINANGQIVGTFLLSDLPVQVSYGPSNTNFEYVQICINDNPNCCEGLEFEAPNCNGGGDCDIWDLEVEAYDCDPNGIYILWINFEYQNPGNDFFDVIDASGDIIGTYLLNELPIEIPYGPSNTPSEMVQVCINDNPNCCETIEFEPPNCNGDCEIWDLIVEAHDCDSDGNFLVDLDFNYQGTSDSFYVMGNGSNYGTYAYSDLWITIGPFPGDGTTDYNFIIMDQDVNNCIAVYNLGTIECDGNTDCSISDITVYPLDCNPDGSYNLILLFDYENVMTDGFDVYSGNTYVGYYLYNGGGPITITSFPASGNPNDLITICDSGGEVCCGSLEFEAPDCEECMITDLEVEALPCNDFNEFQVVLNFNNVGGGDLGFVVFGNGNNYGTFDYDALPITLGPFIGDGITEYEFIVVDLVDNDCLDFVELGAIDCLIPGEVWPGDVNYDNIANNIDLLNVGLAFNSEGPARPASDIDWEAWASDPWSQFFIDGVNFQHADCDGNGIVDQADVMAIDLNYNETHGTVAPFEETPSTVNDPALYLDMPELDEITIGEVFTVPILLGEMDLPVENVYGIAFTIEFDPDMMDEAGVYVEISDSWLGEQNGQLVNINKAFANEGIIEVAISRTDQTNVSGYGTISYFIGIIDDVAGKSELVINITNVRAINNEEIRLPLHTPENIIDFTSSVTTVDQLSISVYPNPTVDAFFISNHSGEKVEQVNIYSTLGQLMATKTNVSDLERVDVSEWTPGIYFVELQLAETRLTKKIKVSNK